MRTYKARLISQSPYSQSRHYTEDEVPKLEKEQPADYEKRTWRYRMHASKKGEVFIPPGSITRCLQDAAKFLSLQIPGKGKQTYTKHFDAGIMVIDPIMLGVKRDEVPGESLFVPKDGKPGGGSRVTKTFGFIESWEGDAIIHVLDETITGDVLLRVLREAGNLIGIGRFRPRNRGYYGRFEVASFEEVSAAEAAQ
jgi:hypothetical protein